MNLDLIKLIYNNILEPIDKPVIIDCFNTVACEIIYEENFIIHEENMNKLNWFFDKIDLDIIINYIITKDKYDRKKMFNFFDILYKIFGTTNKIEEFKKIANLNPDRYHYTIEPSGTIDFQILDGLVQSSIKEINWNKSCIYKCSICFSDNPNILTNCFHQYCKECIFYWYETKKYCPYCKEEILTWTKLNIIDDTKITNDIKITDDTITYNNLELGINFYNYV
jgi:hypothetical protein